MPAAFFTSLMKACSLSLTRTPPKPRKPPSFEASAAFSATAASILRYASASPAEALRATRSLADLTRSSTPFLKFSSCCSREPSPSSVFGSGTPGMLWSVASAANSSRPLLVLNASATTPAPAAASLIEAKMPEGSAAAVAPATSDGANRNSVHSSEVKLSCLAIASPNDELTRNGTCIQIVHTAGRGDVQLRHCGQGAAAPACWRPGASSPGVLPTHGTRAHEPARLRDLVACADALFVLLHRDVVLHRLYSVGAVGDWPSRSSRQSRPCRCRP